MSLRDTLATKAHTVRTLASAGVIKPIGPRKLLRVLGPLHRFGPTPAAAFSAAPVRWPGETAIIDEAGSLTFDELHLRTNALANALAERGLRERDGVAIMCRNHRGFIETTIACSKLGANALYLNTMFSGPQIRDVVEREAPAAIVFDEEFRNLIGEAAQGRKVFVGWSEAETQAGEETLEALIASGSRADRKPPAEPGRSVILTSGTTGTPKGANRSQPGSLDPAAALLSKIPLHARERVMIAAPLFHSWGLAHFTLGSALGSTYVLRRRFDPEQTLAAIAAERCEALIVVPVMLQRILDLGPEVLARYDTSCLRVIALSGSQLTGALATRALDHFGDVVYNLYGSTEVAWATIATPADLRAAPGTAGRPPHGTTLRLYDDDGRPVPQGRTGRIFVANEMLFEGYTGGGGKEVIDGLMSTGDVGHLDPEGRLFVDGRDDDMIVSGGENVFPQEVEELLAAHPAIEEAAVVGVPDEEWGQRLRAVVVLRPGESLDGEAVKAYVKEGLASYKQPRDVLFVDELPRNATGKVLKRELREQALT
jgi:fatty-acyl-CoA synthase